MKHGGKLLRADLPVLCDVADAEDQVEFLLERAFRAQRYAGDELAEVDHAGLLAVKDIEQLLPVQAW